MSELTCDVLVVGGGPGGYVTAIRAGQLGLNTIIVEAERLGGTCLNVGCIPSKALIHVAEVFHTLADESSLQAIGMAVTPAVLDFGKAITWKDSTVERLNSGVAALLRKSKARVLTGWAECVDGKTWTVHLQQGKERIRTKHVVIATGSEPLAIKALPFGGRVVSSTGALSLANVPRELVVVGAGYIGLELGTAFAKLRSQVTVVEAAERILPTYDKELTKPVAARLAQLGVRVLTTSAARGLNDAGDALTIETADGVIENLPADIVLVAVGRKPRVEGFGLERLDLSWNGPFIKVDQRGATSMYGVWAIGDVTGDPMLAHRAMAQGEMAAEIIAGKRRVFNRRAIPAVCFSDPEIVTAGLSPEEARAAGHEVKIGIFPFAANSRAMTKRGQDGFIRIVSRADDHLLLGVQAVGRDISELSTAFGLALEMGATLEDIAGTIHAHPTLGEALQESALRALGHGLHI
jgi:dihydrolipoamide dehydrogenase